MSQTPVTKDTDLPNREDLYHRASIHYSSPNLQKVESPFPVALIRKIFIFNTTSTQKEANTDARLRLYADLGGGDWKEDFPDLAYNERERGRTDAYEFKVEGKGITEKTKLRIELITTEDGWLPSSIFAIGECEDGSYVVMAANPKWTKGWFDRRGKPNSNPEYVIN